MMIEVFQTDVADEKQADEIKQLLLGHFPSSRVNFDLQDRDRVLRVEGNDFTTDHIMQIVNGTGVVCRVLE